MKKVHATKQLFHLYCNMTNGDLEGFKTSSRNVYFSNGVLYSYGSHYPMSRKTSVGVGYDYKEIVLINSNKSSRTTEKHKSQLWSSTKHTQWVFHVPNILDPKAKENEIHLMNGIVDAIDAVLRGIKYSDIYDITKKIEGFNQYATAFKLKQFKLDPVFYTDLAIRSRETTKKHEAKDKERSAKQDAERALNRAKWASEVELWYSCKNTMNISSGYFGLSYDPVRVNGKIVESPRGVHVELEDAVSFCKMLKSGQVQVGMKLSEFEVLSIDSEIVEIGCHKINIKQAIQAVLGE